MTQKDFRKLGRTELLEILLTQAEKIEELEARCEELQLALNERKIVADKMGSIAEASLKINAVFEAAQAAADEYVENVRTQVDSEMAVMNKIKQLLIDTERRCAQMEQETTQKCDAMLRSARKGKHTECKFILLKLL